MVSIAKIKSLTPRLNLILMKTTSELKEVASIFTRAALRCKAQVIFRARNQIVNQECAVSKVANALDGSRSSRFAYAKKLLRKEDN